MPDIKGANLEISATQMETHGQVTGAIFETVVVGFDVRVQDSFVIDPELFHPLYHRLCTKVCQQGVVDLNVAQASGIELLDFLLVRNSNVREIFSWYQIILSNSIGWKNG